MSDNKKKRHIGWLSATTCAMSICLFPSLSAYSQLVMEIPGDERTYIANMIAKGTEPLDIRVTAIHDGIMIRALRNGSKTRQINLLIKEPSPDIKALADLPNMDVRQSASVETRRPDGTRLSNSEVTVVRGGKAFTEWHGPAIWEKHAFGSKTVIGASSGFAPWESKTPMQEFDHDFALAVKLKKPTQRQTMSTAILAGLAALCILVWIIISRLRRAR